MALDFQSPAFVFPTHSGIAQSLEQTLVFATRIRRAGAAINGFGMGFSW
jgi:hypothetical protein